MRFLLKKAVSLFVLVAITLVLVACGPQNKYYKFSVNLDSAFQSPNSVDFWVWKEDDVKKFEALAEELNTTLNDLDKKFNIQDRGDGVVTDLMKINRNAGIEPVKVDEEVIFVIKQAIEVSKETEIEGVAVYDVTIAPVWQLWDFPNKTFNIMDGNYYNPPSKESINKQLSFVDYKKIIINESEGTIYLTEKGMGIDLGSIVKGYAADKLKQVLIKHGIKKAVIDVGRNILLLGNYFDKENDYVDMPMNVSIVTPYVDVFTPNYEEVQTFGKFKVSDLTVVTSGTYEKYIKDEAGNEYHHILDPRTGYPFNHNVVSISVVTKESIKGDAYSTALFSLGIERGMELVNSKEGLDAIWVIRNNNKYEVYISNGLEGNFEFNQNVERLNFVYKGVYK